MSLMPLCAMGHVACLHLCGLVEFAALRDQLVLSGGSGATVLQWKCCRAHCSAVTLMMNYILSLASETDRSF